MSCPRYRTASLPPPPPRLDTITSAMLGTAAVRHVPPRRAQLLSLPRDYVLFALFTSLSRPTVPNCDLILFFCLLLAGISDFNYGPWLSSSRCGRDRVYCWVVNRYSNKCELFTEVDSVWDPLRFHWGGNNSVQPWRQTVIRNCLVMRQKRRALSVAQNLKEIL